MTRSILPVSMAEEFEQLHPQLQKRFDVGLENGLAFIGTGVMTEVRRGPWWTVPFLHLGRMRNILLPDHGKNVPFRIQNFPYRDPFGRETVTFVRDYMIRGKSRQFDATMVLDRGRLVDYLGTHQHLAVDLKFRNDGQGGMHLRSESMYFFEGPLNFKVPAWLIGVADLHERYDESSGRFLVDLEVSNKYFGFLFGYRGWFEGAWVPAQEMPEGIKPRRHEVRTLP